MPLERSLRASCASIGSIFTCCVPTTRSTTPAERLISLLAFLLRDAAGDGDDRIAAELAAHLLDLAEPRVELVFGALAHAAGVDDDQVGVGVGFGAVVAGRSSSPAMRSESWTFIWQP